MFNPKEHAGELFACEFISVSFSKNVTEKVVNCFNKSVDIFLDSSDNLSMLDFGFCKDKTIFVFYKKEHERRGLMFAEKAVSAGAKTVFASTPDGVLRFFNGNGKWNFVR